MRNTIFGLAAAGVLAMAGGALAAPGVPMNMSGMTADNGMVQKVHGCHRKRKKGGWGWHRHVGPNCWRKATPKPKWARRAPVCPIKCFGFGPFRYCERQC